MPNYTAGSTRVSIADPELTPSLADGSVVLDSRRVRPFWFDGRFMDARDLEREQNYFLIRQADLGQAGGFEVMHGLEVDQTQSNHVQVGPGAIVIHAGEGVTPAGEMVTVPNDLTIQIADLPVPADLDVVRNKQTFLATAQQRSGLYVIALYPVEYTANLTTAFPTTVQGPPVVHDSDIVQATAISLIPYPNPPNNPKAPLQAALAKQVFVTGNAGALPDSVLPLALISLDQNRVQWIDPYLVRRDIGPQYSGVRFGLTDVATQQAYLMQFDMHLQSVIAARQAGGMKANFAASDYFQSIPPAARFPIDGIDTSAFSQVFFPQEMDVRLSIIPTDQVAALFEESLSLPPIDLTLPSGAYSNMAVFAFIPVDPAQFATLKNSLPETPLNPTLPQVLANRKPIQLLRLFRGDILIQPVPPISNNAWASIVGDQQFAYYLRRRSDPTMVNFLAPSGVTLASSANPSTVGQSVTFTASISPGSATGTVDFSDTPPDESGPAVALGTATVSAGVASLAISSLLKGSHNITAFYDGDAHDAVGSSPVLVQIVNLPVADVAISSSANPSTVGQSVTFTATVSPASATGTVQFADGATVLGSATLDGGAATLAVSTLAVGAHSITAIYSGDDSNGGNTSAVLTQNVIRITPVLTLTSSANPATVQQTVTWTAQVSGSATGAVQFLDGTTVLGSAVLSSAGTASLSSSTLAVGAHTITANYSGDTNNEAATASLAQTVDKIASNVSLDSGTNPSTFGQAVTFTATVSPASASGTIQFLDGTTSLGTGTLTAGQASLIVASLSAGTHTITALYGGDAITAGSQSPVLSQVVNQVTSSVALTSAPNPSTFGAMVTFTATVTPSSATGSVQFLDGTIVLGTGAISGGIATFATAALTVGTHSITAAYTGDSGTSASNSAVLSQTVNKAASTVALSSSLNPALVGDSVAFTAGVTPASATGTVQFLEGATSLGTATLSSGTAALNLATLSVGSHSIVAAYSGDGDTVAANSNTVIEVINKITSSVALTSSLNPSIVGNAVNLTATVTPTGATGTVQFLEGATVLGTATLTGEIASLTLSSLTVGVHSITADYNGDANNSTSVSAPLSQTVNQNASTVTLSSSPNPSIVGSAVALAAVVSPSTATGTVQFNEGATPLGSAAVSSGGATLSDSSLALGTHTITAVYSGDANDAASTSAPVTQTVIKATSNVTLSSSPNPSIVGASVTFTATVTPATATGTVQFLEGTNVLGSGTIAGGVATLAISTLAVGAHTITASYGGDATNASDASPALTQTVNKIVSAVSLANTPNPSVIGSAVTLTAAVTPNSATGNVQFLEGTNILGSGTLGSGAATLSVSNLAVGAHSIVASYGGDASDSSANSAAVTQTVNKAVSSVTLSSSLNPSIVGNPVTLQAAITPASATGAVQFLDGAIVLGTAAVSSGTASLTLSSLAVGTHTLTANYGGDASTSASTSSPVTQTVNKIASSVTLTSSLNPSTAGATVTFIATVSPATATGIVQFVDGTAVLATGTLSGGVATAPIANLSVGTHSITAVYPGDANDAPATSPVLTQTVDKVTAAITLVSSANPSSTGNPITFTATVSPKTATGIVQFTDGATPMGTRPLTGGVATFTVQSMSVGSHDITAVYSGDANNTTAKANLKQVVVEVTTRITLDSSVNPSTVGQTVTFVATVATAIPASPTGTVQFSADGQVVGTAPLAAGIARLNVANLAVGSHTITAAYSGDASHAAATSPTLTQTVNKSPTRLTLASSLNPSTVGALVTFTATVTPQTATGLVQFADSTKPLGTATLKGGVATLTVGTVIGGPPILAQGTHTILAMYGGDANTGAAPTASIQQTVNQVILLKGPISPTNIG